MTFDFGKKKQPQKGLQAAPSLLPTKAEEEEIVQEEQFEELQEELQETVEEHNEWSEAQHRFRKAQWYDSWLSEDWVDSDDPAGLEAAAEVKAFVHERYMQLLGMMPEKRAEPSLFTEDEVKVIKQLVARLLKKPELAQPTPPPEPTIKKPAPPVKPTLRKVSAPKKPVGRPSKPKTEPSQAQAVAAPPQDEAKPTGEVVTLKGLKYVQYSHPKRGDYWLGPNGQKYIQGTNPDGEPYMKNITEQARPAPTAAQPLPPLNKHQLEAISQQKAQQQVYSINDSTATILTGLGVSK